MIELLFLLGAGLILWLIYRSIRHQPQAFSRENLGKSFHTLGILALILIVIIGLLVLFLKSWS